MVYSYFITNNPLRYYRFYQSWTSRGHPLATTFVSQFMDFLLNTYGSWNGTDSGGTIEGAERWTTSTNRCQLDTCTNLSLLRFHQQVEKLNVMFQQGYVLNEVMYDGILHGFKKSLAGVGDLVGQKMLHCSVMLGLVKDSRLLNYCTPGSSIYLQRLGAYGVERGDQVKQLVRVMTFKRGISALKAEEIMCYCLKDPDCQIRRWDVIATDSPLYHVRVSGDKAEVIMTEKGMPDRLL